MKCSVLVWSAQFHQKDRECPLIPCNPVETALSCVWVPDMLKPKSWIWICLPCSSDPEECRGAGGVLLPQGWAAEWVLPGATAPLAPGAAAGREVSRLTPQNSASDLPRESMTPILDHCHWLTFTVSYDAPWHENYKKRTVLEGKRKKMDPTAKVKWRIWLYYWDIHVKQEQSNFSTAQIVLSTVSSHIRY